MDDNSIMPFGKYKGKKLSDIPDDYFLWLHGVGINPKYYELEEYIEENLDAFKANVNRNRWYNKEE